MTSSLPTANPSHQYYTTQCYQMCTYQEGDVQVFMENLSISNAHIGPRTHHTLKLDSPVHTLLQTPISYQCWVTLHGKRGRKKRGKVSTQNHRDLDLDALTKVHKLVFLLENRSGGDKID